MTDPTSPTMEEQLVAYLDGELDERATQEVERQLSEDAVWRGALQQLQQAWDCLDELPLSEADDTFARSTIEMVVQHAEQELHTAENKWQQVRQSRWLRGGLWIVGALSAGFLLSRAVLPDPDRELLRDLPLIVNVERLTQVRDIRFLKLLDERNLFPASQQGDAETSPAASQHVGLAPAAFLAGELGVRRQYVTHLSPPAKLRLSEQETYFQNLSQEERQQIRQVYADLAEREHGEQLFELLVRFHDWLGELPVSQQVELVTLELEAQVERIQELRARDQLDFQHMSARDQEAIRTWLATTLEQRLEPLVRTRSRSAAQLRQRIAELADLPPQERILRLGLIVWTRGGVKRQPITRAEVETLLQKLSAGVGSAVEAHVATNDPERAMHELARKWVIAAAGFQQARQADSAGPPRRREPDLGEFFATGLSRAQRIDLLQMPLEEMAQELRRLHREQATPGADAPPPGPPPPTGHRPPPPPPPRS